MALVADTALNHHSLTHCVEGGAFLWFNSLSTSLGLEPWTYPVKELLMRRGAWPSRKGAPLMLSTSTAHAQSPLTPTVLLHRICVTFIRYHIPLHVGTVSPSIDTVSPTILQPSGNASSFWCVLHQTPTPMGAWLYHMPLLRSLTYDSWSQADLYPAKLMFLCLIC